jgi:hypothetical protein
MGGQNDCYSVVGDASVLDEVMNGEALLGPMPDGYVAVWTYNSERYQVPSFLKTSNMTFLSDNPRYVGLG